ncbi:MAG: glycosyltransferase [Leifsonia sp.]
MTAAHRHDRSLRVLVAHPGAELFGSDRMLVESVAGLRAAGHSVLVTVPNDGPLLPVLRAAGASVRIDATPVLRKSFLTPRGLIALAARATTALFSGLRLTLRARPDIIFVNTLTIPVWLVVGRLSGRPVICHVHEAERSAGLLLRRGLAAPVLLADTIVTNSRFSADVLDDAFSALGRRTTIVHNGIAGPDRLSPAREELVGALRVLYVGRLSDRKGVDLAIAAIARLQSDGIPAELEIVGSVFAGNEEFEAGLHRQVEDAGLDDSVRMLGFQSDVWSAYERCDVAVVPSRVDEPFGNTAVEAVLAGRPVVVSDTSGLREAASGFESAQHVRPGDADSIATALRRVHDEWAHFRSAAFRDRLMAAQRHSPEAYRTRICEAVDATAGGRTWKAADAIGT